VEEEGHDVAMSVLAGRVQRGPAATGFVLVVDVEGRVIPQKVLHLSQPAAASCLYKLGLWSLSAVHSSGRRRREKRKRGRGRKRKEEWRWRIENVISVAGCFEAGAAIDAVRAASKTDRSLHAKV